MNRIAAVGMFDGVHLGHLFVVDRLRNYASELGLQPMLITFRSHPLEILRPEQAPPLLTAVDERTELLRTAGVEIIEVLDFDKVCKLTAEEFLGVLHHDFDVTTLLMGFNNHIGSDRRTAAWLGGHCAGVDIIELPPAPHHSQVCSSAARSALAQGQMGRVRAMLGRPYSLRGKVVHGKHLGRQIGFPTANIEPARTAAPIPGQGVYAADIFVPGDDTPHRAMLNIGRNPTVGGEKITIEAHIIDFDKDLYGQTVRIDFLERLRSEQRFGSLDELKAQLGRDRLAALAVN